MTARCARRRAGCTSWLRCAQARDGTPGTSIWPRPRGCPSRPNRTTGAPTMPRVFLAPVRDIGANRDIGWASMHGLIMRERFDLKYRRWKAALVHTRGGITVLVAAIQVPLRSWPLVRDGEGWLELTHPVGIGFDAWRYECQDPTCPHYWPHGTHSHIETADKLREACPYNPRHNVITCPRCEA